MVERLHHFPLLLQGESPNASRFHRDDGARAGVSGKNGSPKSESSPKSEELFPLLLQGEFRLALSEANVVGVRGRSQQISETIPVKTLVIVATYNERENIEALASEILSSPIGAELLIVDDNSPDGTGALADRLAAGNPRVRVIHRTGKLGLGSAALAGLRFALGGGYEFAVLMDADFSHHPRHLAALVQAMETLDVAIGSRYVPRGGVVNRPIHRRMFSRLANAYARLCLGLRVHDCSGSFRCYRLAGLKAAVLDRMVSSGYSYLEEILYRCQSAGMKLGEVPIVFEDRRRGRSKASCAEVWDVIRMGVRVLFERVTHRRR
jgi:dolichol-phosphate mannosyltransferase